MKDFFGTIGKILLMIGWGILFILALPCAFVYAFIQTFIIQPLKSRKRD
jgi:hypothetical protein